MSLGEASVDIRANTGSFEADLTKGVESALKDVESAASSTASAFEEAFSTAASAVTSNIDGIGENSFDGMSAGAESAADELTSAFESAADEIAAAMEGAGDVSAGALSGAADEAAGEFDSASDEIASSIEDGMGAGEVAANTFSEAAAGALGKVTAAAVALAAVFASGIGLVKAGEQAATSRARIEQIATSMGMFGDETQAVTQRLEDYAAAAALRTGEDVDAIMQGQALILTFAEIGNSADEAGGNFDRATAAAIDLAAAGFGSMESNAIALGKALNDPVKGIAALSRSGVTFTETEKDMIKAMVEAGEIMESQDFILQAIEKQIGGTAEATANYTDILGQSFKMTVQDIGELLLPSFNSIAATLVETVFPAIDRAITLLSTDFNGTMKDVKYAVQDALWDGVDAFVDFAEEIGFARDEVWEFNSAIGDIYIAVRDFASEMRDNVNPALQTANQYLTENRDAVLAVITGLTTAVTTIMAYHAVTSTATALTTAFSGAVSLVSGAITLLGGPIVLAVAAIAAIVAGVVYAYFHFESFRNIVDGIIDRIVVFGEIIWGFLQDAWAALTEAFEAIQPIVEAYWELLVTVWTAIADVVVEKVMWIVDHLDELWQWIDENFISTFVAALEFLYAVWERIEPVMKFVMKIIKAALDYIWSIIQAWWSLVEPFIKVAMDVFVTIFRVAFDVIKGIVQFVFNTIKSIIENVLGVIRGIFQTFTGLLTGDFNKVWEGIKTIVSSAFGFIIDVVKNSLDLVWTTFKSVFENLIDFFKGVPGRLKDIGKGIFDFIKDSFKAAINFIIDGWNAIEFKIPGFKIGPIGYDGFTLGLPDIPRLANGAIVNRATLGVFGEAGAEAVIPLTRPARALSLMEQAGLADLVRRNSTSAVTIGNATFVEPTDVDLLAQKIMAAERARSFAA